MVKEVINTFIFKTMTQLQAIALHLLAGKSLTSLQAIAKYGCTRVSSRICELRDDYGWVIQKTPMQIINRYGHKTTVTKYWMNPEDIKEAKSTNF